MSRNKIMVMGSFKTGTSSISNLISKSKDNIELLNGKHNRGLKNEDFDILIIPIRKHFELFPSAYFQDITKKEYPYFYNENQKKILNENVLKLIFHFFQFDWSKYTHLSPNISLKHLKEIIKEDNQELKLNNEMYYLNEFTHKFTGKKFKVLIIGFCYLSFEKVSQIFKKINLNIKRKFFHANNGNQKWYSKKYIEFKNVLKKVKQYDDYQEKYKHLDDELFN